MNQSFKKKAIAVGLASAFVVVGAGFVAVPGVVEVNAAHANAFADTTQQAAVSAGVNVPASATAALTGQTLYINESVGAALSTGKIIIAPSSGSKFVSASAASSKTAGTTLLTLEPTSVDSNGNLIIPISAASSVDVTGSKIAITSIVMDTSSASVGTAVTATISATSTVTGLTTGTTTTLANVAAAGVTVASNATTATKVATGQTLTMDQVNVTESILTTFANNATVGADVTIELPSGLTWVSAPIMATLSGTDVATSGTTGGAKLSSTGAGYAKASYYFNGTASTSASAVKFSGGTVFVPTGTTAGDLNVTVTVYKSNAVLSTSTVKIGEIVTSGTTASFVDASGSTATADYNTLFTGRSYTGGLAAGVGAEADTVKVAEVVGASLAANGNVTLAMSTGKFGAAPTKTDTTLTLAAGALSSDSKTASYTVSAASTAGNAGNSVFTFGNLDMTNATAGDLNITVGGTAGVTAATVKLADVVNATSASVASGAETVTANAVFTIPTITIQEGKYSALAAANVIGIELPAGYTIQKGTADATDGATLTNGTDVTVKVVDTTGTDVTTTALGASPTLTVGNGATGTARQLFITMSGASGNAAGTYTMTITGLKAKSSSSATAGDINAVIAGASSAGTSTVAVMTTEDASIWTSQASATKQTVKVGSIVSSTVPSIPAATASGTNTALTMSASVVASGNDQGKIGTLFVIAVLPNGQLFSRNSAGNWKLWDGSTAFDSVEAGVTLGTHTVDILSTAMDVSGIVGTQVYVGYGVGALGTSAYTNLLSNATYAKVYTIQ